MRRWAFVDTILVLSIVNVGAIVFQMPHLVPPVAGLLIGVCIVEMARLYHGR